MVVVVFEPSRAEDRDEIIDFANMVFSMGGGPHDFKVVGPKVYADDAPLYRPDMQFIARENGRIVGLVAMLPVPMSVCGNELTVGYIGTVSTHPYARGHGAMKALMGMALDAAKREGMACLALGGRRQRYGYFGYSDYGMTVTHSIEEPNVRHGLRNVDASGISFKEITSSGDQLLDTIYAIYSRLPVTGLRTRDNFYIISRTWNKRLFAVIKDGECVGWTVADKDISEVVLRDPVADSKPFMKAWYAAHGEYHLSAQMFDAALQREAASVCEGFSIRDEGMLSVIDWPTTVGAAMALKRLTHPMPDGIWTIQVDDDPPLTMEVSGGATRVEHDRRAADAKMNRLRAQEALFSRQSIILPDMGAPAGWFPLWLGIREADKF